MAAAEEVGPPTQVRPVALQALPALGLPVYFPDNALAVRAVVGLWWTSPVGVQRPFEGLGQGLVRRVDHAPVEHGWLPVPQPEGSRKPRIIAAPCGGHKCPPHGPRKGVKSG